MPAIRPSSDLRNKYSDISAYCHSSQSPVFITKNGAGDLAVMSIEAYERLVGLQTLRAELDKGLQDMKSGKTLSAESVFRQTFIYSVLETHAWFYYVVKEKSKSQNNV